ncbi:hypothetical protein N0V90_007927 [Kalmusia sp. IMI 367209]|nr:hypothetical protein N0V90_007927 [Kalmusia sp. IMI 367209]
MPSNQRRVRQMQPSAPMLTKITNFDLALEALRADLSPSGYPFYEEAFISWIQARASGGDTAPWEARMCSLVNGKPLAEMTHEGVMFLLEEMVRDFVAALKFPKDQ